MVVMPPPGIGVNLVWNLALEALRLILKPFQKNQVVIVPIFSYSCSRISFRG